MAAVECLSSLTIKEWIEVKSTLLSIGDKRFSCSHCLSKYAGRKDGEKMVEAERQVKACREIRKEPFLNIEKKIFYNTCPGNFHSPAIVSYLSVHEAYRKGTLPYPGAFQDQPNKVIELFNCFDAYYADEAEKARKAAAMKGKVRRG